ncbi:MAG TPA: hypothetical protein VEJ87_01610, partial [Acidimicrobiales bacterium]|nr:hypothetical protein [Acidimicrobiales bacterium]
MAPLLSVSVVALLLAPTTTGAQTVPTAGEQGTNTALPLTSSAVTVHGRGNFSGLNITVNQTKNLENQDISVTWTGGPLTDAAPLTWNGTFADNYLQMFECWGDPQPGDPLDSVNPGPPPTQCEMGGESVNPTSSYPIGSTYYTNAYTRIMDDPGWSTYTEDQTDPANDWTDQATGQEVQPFVDTVNSGQLVEPFVSVDGTIVNQQDDGNFANTSPPQPFWLNPYFSFNTTNEVDFAQTYGATSGGTVGQQQFQVDTGLEAPGLGCGQDSETLPDGKTVVPQCWLVIVPRGTALQENPSNVNVPQVYTSPLSPSAWANRIAIPLSFNPVGGSCSIGANETRIEGNELAETAVSSWQPALCGKAGGTQYSYSSVSDDLARGNITNPTYGAAGMSVFSDPIPTEETDPSNPVVYAPLTLSGVAVAFNIDRVPGTDADGDPYPSEVPLQGTPVQNIYLTPLLVAKLLTESYQGEFQGEQYTKQSRSYAWVKNNPPSIVDDPDFLQYNPEFTMLQTGQQQAASTLVVEESSS